VAERSLRGFGIFAGDGDNFEDLLWADVGRTTAPGCVGQDLADPTLYRRIRLLAFHDTQLAPTTVDATCAPSVV
tara:strand:- start:87 stop:308 length:222 start_codon:yes stop_codon:yes gene_type:complete